MKKTLSALYAAGLVCSLAACSANNAGNGEGNSTATASETTQIESTKEDSAASTQNDTEEDTKDTSQDASNTDYSNQTLACQVTEINGSQVTVVLGTLNEMQPQGGPQDGQSQDGNTPPQMPDGEQPQGGQSQDGNTPPQMPDGEQPQDGQSQDGNTPPQMPDGEQPQGGPQDGQSQDGNTPPQMPDGNMSMFTAGEETAVFDLSQAAIKVEKGPETTDGSLSDIEKDSILVIEVNDQNIVTSVTIKMAGGMGNPDGQGGNEAKADGQIGSWNMGGTNADSLDGDDYAYDSALYITSDGIDDEKSDTERISGTFDSEKAENITIDDSESGHNGILVYNASYSIQNANIDLLTDADGSDTCDFSGKGTAIAAFGKDASVTVEDSEIHTSGVASMPIFADDGATLTVKNSVLTSDGGTLYKEYMNSPSQTVMVAPPWILGIMGTSRCSNLMGTNTTANFIDCDTSAGAWAVLSTDAGTNMALNVFNTTLTLTHSDESEYLLQEEGGQISETLDNPYTVNYGSGYGTYVIGNVSETFAGATMNVGTYATIFTSGSARFTSLEKGMTYELTDSSGNVTAEYTATEDKNSVINSDTFGFMVHQASNSLTLEKGTEVNTGYATFLVKSGSSNETFTASIDDTIINNGGVLIQVMDNDDATNGGMMSTDDEANTNGGSQNFIPVHTEEDGFSSDTAKADSSVQSFAFTNGSYSGNIYNASGSNGLDATTLNVTFGEGSSYFGAAASTSSIHVTYDGSETLKENGCFAFDNDADAADFAASYQNTSFTINEYFDIGQVANKVFYNGGNDVNITLTDDAVWNVTGTSSIASLTISDDAKVVIPEGVTLTVGDKTYTGTTLTETK